MNYIGVKDVPELKKLAEKYVIGLPYFFWKCMNGSNLKHYMDALLVAVASNEFKDPSENKRITDSVNSKKPVKPIGCSDPSLFAAMKFESNRLKSFEDKWRSQCVKPHDLAASGMFYFGVDDRVQCAFCRGVIANWKEGDVPIKEHAQHYPMCPFLLGSDVGNVPISTASSLNSWEAHNSHPECYSSPPPSENSFEIVFKVARTFVPKHPSLRDIDVRLRTFTEWPASEVVKPQKLAEAGFFYTGTFDVVICYCCDGKLKSWEPGDEPWIEHAKHFPKCEYVRFIKGSEFVECIQSGRNQHCESASNNIPISNACSSGLSQNSTASGSEDVAIAHNGVQTSSNAKHMCKVCMEEDAPRVAFMPCGHSLACPRCAAKLSLCPVCRKKIDTFVRIYFE